MIPTRLPLLIGAMVALSGLLAAYIPPDFYGEPTNRAIGFWRNYGQVIGTNGDPMADILFYSDGGFPRLYMQRDSKMSFVMAQVDTTIATLDTLRRLDMTLTGEGVHEVDPDGVSAGDHLQHFFLPHCGANGITNVDGYSRVVYESVYDNIDMHLYSGARGQKMAFVIRSGGNPEHLQLLFEGQDSLGVNAQGAIEFYMGEKWLTFPEAVAYQVGPGNTVIPLNWTADYTADNNSGVVSFEFDTYDPDLPLVLLIGPPPDMGTPNAPGVCWATYFGGDGQDKIAASALDDRENYYVAGYTNSQSINFPILTGTVLFEASPIVFLSRFNAYDVLRWSSFYGGSSGDQYATSIAVTAGDNPSIYIGGVTQAADLWISDPGTGAYYDTTGTGPFSSFIAKFDTSGSQPSWSTYFGNGGFFIRNIAVDKYDRLVVVGESTGDLPVHQVPLPAGAEQWAYSGGATDAFVALFTPLDEVLWSTFVGGTGYEFGRSVRWQEEKLVMAGHTSSDSLQLMDPGGGAYYEMPNGIDLFILEFDLNGDQQWGTAFGGTDEEELGEQGLALDPATGDVFVVGRTYSDDLPLHDTGQFIDSTANTTMDGMVAEFDGDTRALLWSTYIGGTSMYTRPIAVIAQPDGGFFVGGNNDDDGFTFQAATGLYSVDTVQVWGDGLLMCFRSDHALLWSTYFGGSEPNNTNSDIIWSLAVKPNRKLYAAGTTWAAFDMGQYFPLTDPQSGAWFDDVLNQPEEAFIAGFCIEDLITSVNETTPIDPQSLQLVLQPDGQLMIMGLKDGLQRIMILDAGGREVWSGTVSAQNGRGVMQLPMFRTGLYLVQVGTQGAKLVYPLH